MTVMHIASTAESWFRLSGNPMTLCGIKLTKGAGPDAPMCPACVAKAGWTKDKRQNHAARNQRVVAKEAAKDKKKKTAR